MDENSTKNKEKSHNLADFNAILSDFESETGSWKRQSDESVAEFRGADTRQRHTRKPNKRRYPLWFSTFKVRQSILFSKVPTLVSKPIIDDKENGITTLACGVVEKLGSHLIDSFPFFRVLSAARDDLLLTCMGICRVMFDTKTVQVPIKIPVQEEEIEDTDPQTGQPFVRSIFVASGEPVEFSLVKEDSDGSFYIESDETEEKPDLERSFLKPVSYKDFMWDYEAREFSEWEWCAFRSQMTTRRIKELFGSDALSKLEKPKDGEFHKPLKRHKIIEFWYKPDRTRYIFSEGGGEFLQEDEDPYGLDDFFPVAFPLFDNLETECTIPVTEYAQVRDILSNISDIFDKMAQAVRLARPRALYDSSIKELSKLVSKSRQGDYIGIPNLATKIKQGQTAVQYLDVTPIVNTIVQLQGSFDKELQAYDQVTGYSNISRGFVNPYESATATERKSQFTLNRYSALQEDVQRFCRDNIVLMIDLALGKFSDERLWEILQPSLTEKEKDNWDSILALLRSDYKRSLSVDIETDSTIMIDEAADKAHALELSRVMGEYMQKMAQTAQSSPELLPLCVKVFEHVINKVRGGRAFQDDIQGAVKAILDKQAAIQAQQAQQGQQPDVKMLEVQLKQGDQQLKAQKQQVEAMQAQAETQIKQARLQLDSMFKQMQLKLQDRELNLEERDQLFKEFMENAHLELDQVVESLTIQEKFMEEQRLASEIPKLPTTVVVPPANQTNVVAPPTLLPTQL
jgi:hypothetical protein